MGCNGTEGPSFGEYIGRGKSDAGGRVGVWPAGRRGGVLRGGSAGALVEWVRAVWMEDAE